MTTNREQLRFLVVDDNEDIRDVFTSVIKRAGHLVATATDGVEAIEAVKSDTYDAMLLDLTMPRMTGVEVVRWLRENDEVATDMRVIVVSAWIGRHRHVLDELGVDRLIDKPVRVAQLNEVISELSSKK